MKKLHFILLIFGLSFRTTYAQTNTAEITPFLYNVPDTLISGDTVRFGFYIKNTGTNVFIENIFFDLGTYDTSQVPQIVEPYAYSIFYNIPVGDSVYTEILDTLNVGTGSNSFRQGNNIVVVWPRSNMNSTITGEAIAHIYLMQLLKIAEKDIKHKNIFINQSANEIFISSTKGDYQLELWSMDGKNMISKESHIYQEKRINTEDIRCGIYLLVIKSKEEIVLVKKIIIK